MGIGSVAMDANQPGLFELPDREQLTPLVRLQRGRNREIWALTATAEVTITDGPGLQQAAAGQNEGFVVAGLRVDVGAEGSGTTVLPAEPANDAFDALAWLIWPNEGLEGVLEAGAARILTVDSEVVASSVDRGTATWRVRVKLTDVDELRRLAARAHPEESALISDSLAAAWLRAADPFAPLRAIPGIAWEPGRVLVEHVPARGPGIL